VPQDQASSIRETDTIVIGAGPAGLAVGAALRRKNVPFEILERSSSVGSSWRTHYERLHLHTPKRQSELPFVAFADSCPRYPSRRQVLDYLDNYAREFDLQPRFGEDVRCCTRSRANRWEVQTGSGVWRSRHLVVATGFNRVPQRPAFPGLDTFSGPVLHSSEFANGESFRGQRVLVVGFGNSGAEIAIDLVEHGASSAIAVRGPVNVVPRDILGIPIIWFALATRYLPPRIADRLNAATIRLAVGNLARLGLRKRNDGPNVEILEQRRIPVIDVGTLALIESGRITMRPGIESLSGNEICFSDGRRERFDAIVLATGFATGLRAMLPDVPDVLDAVGHPHCHGRESSAPGLYFCGFHLTPTGLLREIAIEARRIGEHVASNQSDSLPTRAAKQP
jgi:indole-3-pyruvate monooxygenase